MVNICHIVVFVYFRTMKRPKMAVVVCCTIPLSFLVFAGIRLRVFNNFGAQTREPLDELL